MTNTFKSAVAAALLLGGASAAFVPAALAQDTGPLVPGVAVVNLEGVVANANAFKTAQQQRPTTYKAQIDQAQARKAQIEAQLQPLGSKFEKDRSTPNFPQATLQQEYQTIQSIQQSGQQEIQRILQPVSYSEQYVTEQIEAKLGDAIKVAMAKKKISLLLTPQAIVSANNPAYNLNQDVLDALNLSIPSAQVTPPAGWEPREVREQRAQQQAQQGPAPAAGKPQPAGR